MTVAEERSVQLHDLAARLAEAWQTRNTIDLLSSDERPKDREEAMIVQDRMVEIVGDETIGWKIGATSPRMRQMDGFSDIIPGRLLRSDLFVGAEQSIDADRFPGARIEAEFAFRLERDLPVRPTPWTLAEVTDAIVLLPAIEIIGDRFAKSPDRPKLDEYTTIADNGGGFGFVAGDTVTDWRDIDFLHHHVGLTIDDGPQADNFLGDMRCQPVQAVTDLANALGARGIGLKTGEFVTTGAAAVPQPISRGNHAVADYGRLGRIAIRFE